MTRKRLQLATAVLAAIPLVTGVLGLMGVQDPLYAAMHLPNEPMLDSNMRFFGGVWLALGIAVLWLIPNIERQTELFRAVWGMVFRGGVVRLLSLSVVGWPPFPVVAVTLLELMGAPLFVAWHMRVARAAAV